MTKLTNHGLITSRDLYVSLIAYRNAHTSRAFVARLTAIARASVVARPEQYTRELQRAIAVRL